MTRKIKPLIHLEQLEPRILLSGDGLSNIAYDPHQDVVFNNISLNDELPDTNEQVEEQISLELAQSDTPNTDDCQPLFTLYADNDNTNDESADADLSVSDIGPAQLSEFLALLSNDSDGDIERKVDRTEGDSPLAYVNDNDIGEDTAPMKIRGPPTTETISSEITDSRFDSEDSEVDLTTLVNEYGVAVQPNGFVDLPGLKLVDPDPSNLHGQVIFLDFDGEKNVTYNGPVTIGPFDVPAFQAPGEIFVQEQIIINQILVNLERIFCASGIIFTTERPQGTEPYSTIYIGGDDSAFAEYGRFLGLAEQVDVGNADREDKGIAFADQIMRACQDVDTYCWAMAGVIAHEMGHLVGFSHTRPSTDHEGQLVDVSLLIELFLDTPVTGTLDGSGDSDTYYIEMGAGQHLAVQLDGDNPYDQNELYVRYGALPTMTEYDAAGKEAYRADQYVEIPNTQEGTYYILVRCAWDESRLDSYVLRATLSGIDSVDISCEFDYEVPGIVADDGCEYDVEVRGSGLTGIEFTTPWGCYVDLQDLLPPGWDSPEPIDIDRGPLHFEAEIDDHGLPVFAFEWDNLTEAQWASLETGQTVMVVTWDSGTWSASLDFSSVPQSIQEPCPTSPINRSMEPDNVTVQWSPWNSPPPNSYIYVDVENAWGGGDSYAELPSSATSWTPSTPLGAGGFYECDVGFNTQTESIVGGVSVTIESSAENEVVFVVGIPETSLRVNPDTGHAYFLTAPGPWWQAQAVAAGFGGNLVTVNDEAEEIWLEEQCAFDEMFWIGFTDSWEEGAWEWVSGEPVTYANWAPWGEPNGGEAENAALLYSYWWHDAPMDWWERGIVELLLGTVPKLVDDHENTFDNATVVSVPSSLEGQLSYIGDIDFFSFDAIAGKTYDIRIDVSESGLDDSTVWLYGTDGQTLLAWDDDGGYGRGSRLAWAAPANGSYYLAVDSDVLFDLGGYKLQIAEIDLIMDTPLAWFDHPAIWLDLQGDWGVATSEPYDIGATSDEDQMLHLLSISNPLSPVDVGQYLPGEAEGRTILASPRRYYLSDDGPRNSLGHSELVVLDMGVSGDPVEIYRIPIVCSDADSMVIEGTYLYLATETEETDSDVYLEVYDISNPDTPVFVGQSQPIVCPPGSEFEPDQLLVADGRAYILHREAGIISILDMENPVDPVLLGEYTPSTGPSAEAEYMAIVGSVLWVGVGWELHAIDVSDAANPVQLSVLPLDGRIHQIVIDGGWAYVGTAGLGVKVVDIFNPVDPVVIDSYTVAGAVGTLALNNGHLYIPTGARQTAIFEVPPAPALPDLLVTHVSMPVAVGSGEVLSVEWIVQNRSITPTPPVTWTDAVFLSTDSIPSPDELVATLEHAGGLSGRGVYTVSLDLDTTAIAEGTYYVIVVTDYGDVIAEQRERNNTTVSAGPVSIGITRLTPGVPVPGTFETTSEAHYYVVGVAEGEHLQIVLNDANDIGHNELYVRYGQPPTRNEYDVRYGTNLAADQTVEVPDTLAGDYYVLVYAESAPDALNAPADFTLTASLLHFCIISFSPESGGNTGQVTIQIRGAKFTEGMTAALISPDETTTIEAEATVVVSSSEISATFNLTRLELGAYRLRVAAPSGASALAPKELNIKGGKLDLKVDLVAIPSEIRAGRQEPGMLSVTVINHGNIDSGGLVVWVILPPGVQAGFSPDDMKYTGQIDLNVHPFGPVPPRLKPDESLYLPIYFRVPTTPGAIVFSVELYHIPMALDLDAETYYGKTEPFTWNEGSIFYTLRGDPVKPKPLPDYSKEFFEELITSYTPTTEWSLKPTALTLASPHFELLKGVEPKIVDGEYVYVPAPAQTGSYLRIDTTGGWAQTLDVTIDSVPDPKAVFPTEHYERHTRAVDYVGWPYDDDDDYPFYCAVIEPRPDLATTVFSDVPNTPVILVGALAAKSRDERGHCQATYRFVAEVHVVGWVGGDSRVIHVGEGVKWGYTLEAIAFPSATDREVVTVVGSVDPNDKVGSAGFGEPSFVRADGTLPFTIYYENDPEAGANAPAQVVKIEDTLDDDLDLATFEMGDINLCGDYWIDLPDGLQYYETTVDLRPEGNNLLAHVTAGLDSSSRTVTWLFTSLDPNTLAPPDDPMAGFLPVNDKAIHNGEGHVTYMVRPIGSLLTSAEITNQAYITFDVNDPIATPTTFNTIDAASPTSQVDPLPGQVTEYFMVTWSGQDDENGSGIGSYDIYVSTDEGLWQIWLDDTTETSAEYAGEVGHTYAFRSVATDNVGHIEDDPGVTEAQTTTTTPLFRITLLEIQPCGFAAHLNRAVDTSVLNLYDTVAGEYGPPDVTVVGETVGAVSGSLVVSADAKTVRFIKTGGPLESDTYTVTMRSEANAFKNINGYLLDGDTNYIDGGDYVAIINIESTTARLLSLPDFTRGPGQEVNVPAVGSGIPVIISDGSDILAVDFSFDYDPALLTVTGVTLASGLPSGWALAYNLSAPGHVPVTVYGPTPLDASQVRLVEIEANVPEDAPYRAAAILSLSDIQINEGSIALRSDCAIQVVAYFGDATGNHTYSGLDAAYIARVAVGLDGGFSAYGLKDPVIVADVTGNGNLSGLDAAYVARKSVGLEQPEIPDLPDPLPGIIADGRDPLFSIPENLTAQQGSTVTIPIHVDDAADLFLADIDLQYDTNVLDLSNSGINLGDLTSGWNLISNVDDAEGRVRLSLYGTSTLSDGSGSIVELKFDVRSDAALGVTVIDLLESCSLNEGALVLTLQDGEVTIHDDTTIPSLLAWRRNDNIEFLTAFHNRLLFTHRLHFRNLLVSKMTDDFLREKALSEIAVLLAKSDKL